MNKHRFKTIKHFVFIIILSVSTKSLAAPIINDGFETGDLSKSDNGFSWRDRTSTQVSTDISRTGTRSLKFTYDAVSPGSDSWAEQRFDLGSTYSEVWVQYYIYFPDGTEGLGAKYTQRTESPGNNKFIRLWGNIPRNEASRAIMGGGASMFSLDKDGFSWIGAEYFSTFNGSLVKEMNKNGISPQPLVTANTLGKWIKFKYHVKAATKENNDGVLQIWVNDVLVIDETNLETYPGDGYQNAFTAGYLLGWANTGFSNTTNIYIDDVEIFSGMARPLPPNVGTP